MTGPARSKKAILVVYDIFGFFPQTIEGADILAYSDPDHEYQVFMPDFFHGEPADIAWYILPSPPLHFPPHLIPSHLRFQLAYNQPLKQVPPGNRLAKSISLLLVRNTHTPDLHPAHLPPPQRHRDPPRSQDLLGRRRSLLGRETDHAPIERRLALHRNMPSAPGPDRRRGCGEGSGAGLHGG